MHSVSIGFVVDCGVFTVKKTGPAGNSLAKEYLAERFGHSIPEGCDKERGVAFYGIDLCHEVQWSGGVLDPRSDLGVVGG
jgi:hypothetical protein